MDDDIASYWHSILAHTAFHPVSFWLPHEPLLHSDGYSTAQSPNPFQQIPMGNSQTYPHPISGACAPNSPHYHRLYFVPNRGTIFLMAKQIRE